MAAVAVPITPSVLDWAVDEAGLTTAALADQLGLSAAVVKAWRRGDSAPTTGQFHALARALRRPETFFFLARPPYQEDVPVAFRAAPALVAGPTLSADDAAAVRAARRLQRVSTWLVEHGRRPRAEMNKVLHASYPPEGVAALLRAWLGWDDDPPRGGAEVQFARRARGDLEERNLLVLHMPMGSRGWRGFSLQSDSVPVVVANTYYTYRPRVFTYLHELAHLTAQTENICAINPDDVLERWCDQVASAVLMPAAAVRYVVSTEMGLRVVSSFDEVRRIANTFNASLRAAAIRLEHLGLASAGLYSTVEAIAQVREVRKGGGGAGDPQTTPRVRLQTLGSGYLTPLLKSEADHVLTRADTMELLDVTASQLRELRELTESADLVEE